MKIIEQGKKVVKENGTYVDENIFKKFASITEEFKDVPTYRLLDLSESIELSKKKSTNHEETVNPGK